MTLGVANKNIFESHTDKYDSIKNKIVSIIITDEIDLYKSD